MCVCVHMCMRACVYVTVYVCACPIDHNDILGYPLSFLTLEHQLHIVLKPYQVN